MTTTQMQILDYRLQSFSSTKRIKNKSLTASSSVKWPHPASYAANPKTLAEAGFYFNPSWDERDGVTCFMCGKELSDWTELDDPFDIHWDKCSGSCVWAVVRCGLKGDLDSHGRFVSTNKTRFPASKTMEKARFVTFTSDGWWPHDAVKNHGANSKKMAQAGFVYTPQIVASGKDDTASCLYCQIALGGWDPEDNPLEEHRKRANKSNVPCPFFAPQSESLPATASSKPSSRAKKPIIEASEGEPSEDELELAPPAPKRKGRATLTATKLKAGDGEGSMRRVTRGAGSRAGSVMEEDDDEGNITAKSKGKGRGKKKQEAIEEEDEVAKETVVEKPKRGRPRKTVVQKEEAEEEDEVESEKVVEKPKRGRPRKTVMQTEEVNEDAAEPAKPKSKPRSKSRAAIVESEGESDTPATTAPASKPKSKARSKSRATVVELEGELDVPAAVSKPKSKSKSTKGKSRIEPGLDAPEPETRPLRSKSRANVNAESESYAPAPPPAAKPASKPKSTTSKSTSKAKGGRKKGTVVEEAGMDVDEEGQGTVEAVQAVDRKGKGKERDMKVVDISTDDEGRERAVAPEPEPERKTTEKKKAPVEIEQEQPEPEPMDIHPAPSTPPRPVFSPSPQRSAPTLTNGHPRPPSPASPAQPSSQAQTFLPPLALLPIPHIVSLSETEQDMTVEEWIRHEISLQYEQLKSDGERRIDAFRERAEEVRRRIDAL